MNIHYYPTGICKRCASFLSGKTSVPENSLRLWHTPITFKTEKDCKECTVCTLASSFVRKIDFFNCVLTAFLRLDLVSIIDVKNNLKLKIYNKKIWYLQGQGISRGRINQFIWSERQTCSCYSRPPAKTYIAHWSSSGQQSSFIKLHFKTSVKRFRQIFKKIYKKFRLRISATQVLWPLRLKTHFLLCTSLYLLNQKTYFAIVSRFLCGVWGYANQLFRLNFDHFTGF